MNRNISRIVPIPAILVVLVIVGLFAYPATAGEYEALKGINGVKTVFSVSIASPKSANVVFGAVKNVYEDASVQSLPERPRIAVVFYGPAVKLISTNRDEFNADDKKALDQFAAMLRQMKKDGVKLEVCDLAIKVVGIDPASILPEVDHVGNGFISLAGYQGQGYALIQIN